MWERACSRMRCVSHPLWWLIYCIREQARSHMFYRISALNQRCTIRRLFCSLGSTRLAIT
ncbi:hypothetical protein FJD34_14430 [Pseudomonas brenneri]|uniref:Uncharacterized protein n=1 Tax=Pseudomonas brenneri TaxID=129817 RepID=A0A5B2V3Q4_9PSED|nr:hypothetical protein F1720_04550 [Pseudomonas brenneri]TWR77878.1 hypothetical protein FJD34_14430 [Pseudomonas brenneri]